MHIVYEVYPFQLYTPHTQVDKHDQFFYFIWMCLAFWRAAVLGQVADVVPPVTAVFFTTVQQVVSLLTSKRYY
jgi:hypothetical protein